MATPTGTISASNVNTEKGDSSNSTFSFGDEDQRMFAGAKTGEVSMGAMRGVDSAQVVATCAGYWVYDRKDSASVDHGYALNHEYLRDVRQDSSPTNWDDIGWSSSITSASFAGRTIKTIKMTNSCLGDGTLAYGVADGTWSLVIILSGVITDPTPKALKINGYTFWFSEVDTVYAWDYVLGTDADVIYGFDVITDMPGLFVTGSYAATTLTCEFIGEE